MTKAADNYPRTISTWKDIAQAIEHFSTFNGHEWLFRGVTDSSFALIPKVGRQRVKLTKRPEHYGYDEDDEVTVLRLFKQQASAFVTGERSEIEWMALAQHFGVPTRFLDWTESFLTAVWFAVQYPRSGRDDVDAAVWVTRNVESIVHDGHDPLSKFDGVRIYRPRHIAPRIGAQGSVLMLCPTPDKPVTPPYCERIVIPKGRRFHLSKRLNACGINSRSQFADLSGLGQHIGWLFENNWLAGAGWRQQSSSDE